jgi:electron-transferring-flavoprotein dehydrogenase
VLGSSGAVRLPNFLMPPLMSNHGNFIVSLGDVCRYLAQKAEALGVEIYPGFAAAEVLFENGAVAGVATGDMGVGKDGHRQGGLPAAWSCAPSTLCSPKARAAAFPKP